MSDTRYQQKRHSVPLSNRGFLMLNDEEIAVLFSVESAFPSLGLIWIVMNQSSGNGRDPTRQELATLNSDLCAA